MPKNTGDWYEEHTQRWVYIHQASEMLRQPAEGTCIPLFLTPPQLNKKRTTPPKQKPLPK